MVGSGGSILVRGRWWGMVVGGVGGGGNILARGGWWWMMVDGSGWWHSLV